MKKVIFYRKLKNRLFQICVKNVSFLLILFGLGILGTFAIASNTYTGKYLMTDGVVGSDSYSDSVIRITVNAELVPDIEKENNIKWYASADNVRRKAVIKAVHFDEKGACNLILQPENGDINKIGPGKKVQVIIMYGRKYVF